MNLLRTGGYIYECPRCKCESCGRRKEDHTTEEMDVCLYESM